MSQLPKETKRVFEVWVGEQASGKTLNFFRRTLHLSTTEPDPELQDEITSVFICDTSGQFSRMDFGVDNDGLDVAVVFKTWADFINFFDDGEGYPLVCIFKFGTDWKAYERVFETAVDEGGCIVLLDEAPRFLPSAGPCCKALRDIIFEGRHLENAGGKECVTGVLVGCQYARDIDHQVLDEARSIYCARVYGERSESWLRGYVDKEAVERVHSLEKYRWTVLKGALPALAELELDPGEELVDPFDHPHALPARADL